MFDVSGIGNFLLKPVLKPSGFWNRLIYYNILSALLVHGKYPGLRPYNFETVSKAQSRNARGGPLGSPGNKDEDRQGKGDRMGGIENDRGRQLGDDGDPTDNISTLSHIACMSKSKLS
jgi:hypothetical protein